MKNTVFKKAIIGALAGIISGMFSSGGGLILIPAYSFLFKLSDKESKSTTIFCILPMVITSSIIYGINNYIDWHIALFCAIGATVGSIIGFFILNKLNPKYLKFVFIIFLLYSGIKILFF